MNNVLKRVKDQRGVTLIELLAVIVILGIIAAVAVPAVMSNFDKAKDNADAQTLAIVKEAGQRYLLDNPGATTLAVADLVSGGYLNADPGGSQKTPANTSIALTITSGKVTAVFAP